VEGERDGKKEEERWDQGSGWGRGRGCVRQRQERMGRGGGLRAGERGGRPHPTPPSAPVGGWEGGREGLGARERSLGQEKEREREELGTGGRKREKEKGA
jgi:hypothetical protein